MTRQDMKARLGIETVRKVGEDTYVAEYFSGHASRMTPLEVRMWELLKSLES